jgi:RNA 2',3'-cyclic 3'-phosphodiesterase
MTSEPTQKSELTRVSEPTRRVFFALWPDETVRLALAHATHKAVHTCGGRPVPAHNLHATLLFLGSVAESRIPDLAAIAAMAASSTSIDRGSTAELVFDHVECWRKSSLLVAVTSQSSGTGHVVAGALVDTLRRETIQIGFAPDPKPFRAHITLARKVGRPARSLSMRPVSWHLTALALVESRTEPAGAVYSVLRSFPLVDL